MRRALAAAFAATCATGATAGKKTDMDCTGECTVNDWDDPHEVECKDGFAFTSLTSWYSDRKDDRQFKWKCEQVDSSGDPAASTRAGADNFANGWKGEMSFDAQTYCGDDGYISYAYSQHWNWKEDRRFKFGCRSLSASSGAMIDMDTVTSYGNDWRDTFTLASEYSNARYVMTSVNSYHDNDYEDRRYTLTFQPVKCRKGFFLRHLGSNYQCIPCGTIQDEYNQQAHMYQVDDNSLSTTCSEPKRCDRGQRFNGNSKSTQGSCAPCTGQTIRAESSHYYMTCEACAQNKIATDGHTACIATTSTTISTTTITATTTTKTSSSTTATSTTTSTTTLTSGTVTTTSSTVTTMTRTSATVTTTTSSTTVTTTTSSTTTRNRGGSSSSATAARTVASVAVPLLLLTATTVLVIIRWRHRKSPELTSASDQRERNLSIAETLDAARSRAQVYMNPAYAVPGNHTERRLTLYAIPTSESGHNVVIAAPSTAHSADTDVDCVAEGTESTDDDNETAADAWAKQQAAQTLYSDAGASAVYASPLPTDDYGWLPNFNKASEMPAQASSATKYGFGIDELKNKMPRDKFDGFGEDEDAEYGDIMQPDTVNGVGDNDSLFVSSCNTGAVPMYEAVVAAGTSELLYSVPSASQGESEGYETMPALPQFDGPRVGVGDGNELRHIDHTPGETYTADSEDC